MGSDERESNLIHDSELFFFGLIVAGVTHEMNNILSIINEHSGLVGDLLGRPGCGAAVDAEKLARANESIRKQLERGKLVMKKLNYFAHSVDAPEKSFDLGECLGNLCALMGHHAKKRGISLEVGTEGPDLTITGNPFRIQHLVFLALALLLESGEPGGKVLLRISVGKEGLTVVLSGSRFQPGEPERVRLLDMVSGQTGAEVEIDYEGGKVKIALPRKKGG